MQTFLPYRSFTKSASVLDRSRLNKQILEIRQIMNVLYKKAHDIPVKGWANHPAVTMWSGYEWSLLIYANAMHTEFISRRSKKHAAYENLCKEHGDWACKQNLLKFPSWIGRAELHDSHKQRLLHKGMLDVLRKMKYKPSSKALRDLTVFQVQIACNSLNVKYNEVLQNSHYYQFDWDVEPSDDYIWPKDLPCIV